MASTALSVLSGIAAAAAGMSGEKVAKTGVIPGLDLATIIPALLGSKGGKAGGVLGTVASVALKSGLLNSSNMGKLVDMAGSLFKLSGKADTQKAASASPLEGIAGLAQAIAGGEGTGANLVSIASMASNLTKTCKDEKAVAGLAGELGKTLAGKFGISFCGSGTAVKALDKVLEKDTKSELFSAILKGLIK